MKTRKKALLGTLITMMILAVGCGSASAPPVDLPAPITGRIDVSSPDANGDVTVTGTEGAVTGGTIVMVVNENESGSASMMLYDLLVPSAHAQTFPIICDEVGHACTDAAEDGSFQVIIPGSVGDTLVIGLIDENGEWRSDTIRVVVPESGTPDPGANCSGEGVTGAVVDIAISPSHNIPVMLKQGSDTTTNQLVIGATSPTTVSISGCHAHSIAFYPSATGDSIAVTSQDDKILWAGRFVSGEVLDTRSFDLDYEPMHIAFANLSTQPIVAIKKTSNTVRLARVSTSEGVILSEMLLTLDVSEITGLTRSTALDVFPMGEVEGQYIGLLTSDNGNAANFYLTLFQANGIVHKGTWTKGTINIASPPEKAINSAVAAMLYLNEYTTSQYFVRVAIVDSAATENGMVDYRIMVSDGLGTHELQWGENISDPILEFTSPVAISKGLVAIVTSPLSSIARVTDNNSAPLTPPRACFANSDGILFERNLETDEPVFDKANWAPGDDIVAIDTIPAQTFLFGADATAEAILNGSSYPTW